MYRLKKIIFLQCILLVLITVYACTTKQKIVDKPKSSVVETTPVSEEPEVILVEENTKILVHEPEPVLEPHIDTAMHAEYNRSTSELKNEVIPPDVFENDKKTILNIIDDLSEIMKKKDYRRWIHYISPQSLAYWQNTSNLEAVSARLPVKGLTLKNLEDYFKLIFIPSRLNVTVDEIRYTSSTSVKVVQVRQDQDIICYYFEKIKDEWMLILDTL